ncbi:class I SAM-dependent methyltransferase [Stappia sp. F7233]|uniref:Class I SAM-dependent methyltransferase n=1 Tax=Stappia albiluteola TaxID=2758565 RepID=A0A839AI13_9HYPH|nr:class I SAM-dependent methyltransferase [Stappia albiluteola]MBA5778668.1 class I SAM-dependent methyltransferase [Stappia albiluteola]
MYLDVADLLTFYDLPTGKMLRVLVGQRLREIWPSMSGQRLLGVGYTGPYLRPFMDEAERCVAAMPAPQGVVAWPRERENAATLVDETELPFPDSMFDRVLVVHGIDHSRDPEEMLKEIWRVLAPGGRLIVVVANRRGLWARTETSPFGYGRPYSRSQLEALLKDCQFKVAASNEALFLPPTRSRFVLRSARTWEKIGRRLWPAFAGLLVIEAEKQLFRGVIAGGKRKVRAMKPVFIPQGAAGMHHRSSNR